MDKLNSIIVTIIGVLWILPLIGVDALASIADWLIAIGVLVIGIKGLISK